MIAALACGLAACGGGGGGGGSLASTPPPPPPPVTIFASPMPGEYASVGVSSATSLIDGDGVLTSISSVDTNQVHIRYNSGGYYEIEMPGAAWDRLVHRKVVSNPTSENIHFQPASDPQNSSYLSISKSRDNGFLYSEMGVWATNVVAVAPFGFVAFGTPTPAGAIPVTGSATYAGAISGTTDILIADGFGTYLAWVEGSIALNFNFAAGTLGGSMNMIVNEGMGNTNLGSFAFADTVYSAGSPTYSGKFVSSVPGSNYFLGRFTGPNAQETIGAWVLPFLYPVDGKPHQAIGAFIAKQN